jgi:hypothetical protein
MSDTFASLQICTQVLSVKKKREQQYAGFACEPRLALKNSDHRQPQHFF